MHTTKEEREKKGGERRTTTWQVYFVYYRYSAYIPRHALLPMLKTRGRAATTELVGSS